MTGRTDGDNLGASVRVDPDQVRGGAAACLEMARSMTVARARVGTVAADRSAWACDGGLDFATDRLLATLDWAAEACLRDAQDLAARLAAVASAYAGVEAASTLVESASPPGGDATGHRRR